MTLSQSLNDHLPIGWRCTHVIYLGLANDDGAACWEVITGDDEHCVTTTGDTIEDALLSASAKIHAEKYSGKIDWLANKLTLNDRPEMSLTLASLGLSQPLKLPRPSFAPPSSPATKA